MADSKISSLTELAESPASTDEFVIVDKSDTTMGATGTNKRVQAQYLTVSDATFSTKGKALLVDGQINGSTSKTTPADADEIGITDSAASYVLKKLTWANLKATLLTWLRLSTTIIPVNAPRGFLINGKISVTDAAGITVAIKTLAGNDPSASDPVYCRIGDTVRSITAALSVAKADGTNWCNAGSDELATKEIDYFVYLGYNATDGVVIGFSRYPGANSYDDFSATTTNEKYCAISTITTAAATDYYEVIGRFAATLSAGAGYTWSVPTFTAKNLIQRPIYETRTINSVGTTTGFTSSPTINVSNYKVIGSNVFYHYEASLTSTSNSTGYTIALPFTSKAGELLYFCIPEIKDNSAFQTTPGLGLIASGSSIITLYKNSAEAAWTASGSKGVASIDVTYKI